MAAKGWNKIFTEAKSKWAEGSGPYADIVISSRVRLARNLAAYPFPHRAVEQQDQEVTTRIAAALASPAIQKIAGKLEVIKLSELTQLQGQILVEKHLISPEHAQGEGYRAVALREDEAISLMINEEDHLRIQVLLPAMQLHECWRLADMMDNALEESLDFSFGERVGYLTSCPTNMGTGLRASLMVHLPALTIVKQTRRVLSALSQVGVAVRGLYGEGTEAQGNLFQISNQVTLGRNEEDIINHLLAVARQLIEQEQEARKVLQKEAQTQLEDRTCRAYGILTQARLLSSQEALSLLSDLRLGIDLKVINSVDPRVFNELLVAIQPAYLQYNRGREMDSVSRDVVRATLIRERLQGDLAA